MCFELIVQLGRFFAQDAARHQHAERLAADAPGADHPVSDRDEIVECQVVAGHSGQRRIGRKKQLAQAVEPVLFERCIGFSFGARLERQARCAEVASPVADDAVVVEPAPVRSGEYFRNGAAVGYRAEVVAFLPGVDQVHRRGRPMLDLDRPDIELVAAAEGVEQELRRFGNHLDCRLDVRISPDREIGHRVQIEQARAGEAKEVRHHPVRLPGFSEVREAVENVHRFRPGRLDDRMHLVDERIKAIAGVRVVDFDFG